MDSGLIKLRKYKIRPKPANCREYILKYDKNPPDRGFVIVQTKLVKGFNIQATNDGIQLKAKDFKGAPFSIILKDDSPKHHHIIAQLTPFLSDPNNPISPPKMWVRGNKFYYDTGWLGAFINLGKVSFFFDDRPVCPKRRSNLT